MRAARHPAAVAALLLLGWLGVATCAAITSAPATKERIPVPEPEGYVTDVAGVLAADDRASLTAMLAAYAGETRHTIGVLTVDTLGGETIEAFSLRVANTWKLGLKGWNDGILVTLALQERRTRIELGTGMEAYITNEQAHAILDEAMLPAFRQGDYAGGLRAGLARLMELARKYRITDPERPPPR